MGTTKTERVAPGLFYGNVPESQLEALQFVEHALDNLAYFAECFEADLRLFDHCLALLKSASKKRREDLRLWQFVAARDGAVNIYNFSQAISSVRQSLHECPHLKSKLKLGLIDAAQARFNTLFPNATRLRNSVGHAGEKASNSHQHRKHGYTGMIKLSTGKAVRVRKFIGIDILNKRKYSNTWNQRVETYRISKTTFNRLISIRDDIWEAFDEMNIRLRGE